MSWNKRWFQKWFPDEFNQAILQLEAQKPLLRLCSAQWKAEAMITLLLQNEEGGKEPACNPPLHPSDANAFQFEEPWQVTPILPASVAAPSNVAKRALEFSPGPKSPSASRTQKHSKDDSMPSGQKPASSHSGMLSIFMTFTSAELVLTHSTSTPHSAPGSPFLSQSH